MLPWWRRAMLDYRVRHTGWSGWLRRNARTLSAVKAAIQASGPMGSADFDHRRPGGGRGGWWDWRPVQHALHYLWMNGALAVHSRRHFQKRFDLMERVIPEALAVAAVSSEDFERWHVERSLHAMGAATEADLGRYLSYPRFGPGRRRAALAAMRERGDLTEIEVERTPGRWLALTRDLPALERAGRRPPSSRGTTLLSPFDSLLWHRDRVARLFAFQYRIEVYTPGPQRVHGYYLLPIFHHGHLVGRLDAKAHRGERRLDVRAVHFEPWFAGGRMPRPADRAAPPTGGHHLDREETVAGLAEAIGSLARFVGAAVVTLGPVSPGWLRPPLARALWAGGTIPETTGA
jgi:uncharacterized protein